jgi:hypothetical protein
VVVAWLVVLAVAGALDGAVGAGVAVVGAAVLLAGGTGRWLGAMGVAALVAVPVVVFVRGLPDAASLSPAFVWSSMVPHHLAFAGLAWSGAGALLDLAGYQPPVPARQRPPDRAP